MPISASSSLVQRCCSRGRGHEDCGTRDDKPKWNAPGLCTPVSRMLEAELVQHAAEARAVATTACSPSVIQRP